MLYSALIIWAAARNGSVITAFVGMVLRRSDRLVTCRSSLGESVGRSFVGWAFVVRSFIGQAFVGLSLVRRSFVGRSLVGGSLVGRLLPGRVSHGKTNGDHRRTRPEVY